MEIITDFRLKSKKKGKQIWGGRINWWNMLMAQRWAPPSLQKEIREYTTQSHRMVWGGRDLQRSSSPNLCHGQGHLEHYVGLFKAPSSLTLNTFNDRASTVLLENLSCCIPTLIVKKFFLISNVNLPSSSLKPLSPITTDLGWKSLPVFLIIFQ